MILSFHMDNAAELREMGLAADYVDWQGYDGQVYKRICVTEVPGLRQAIEDRLGPVDMLGMGFRLNYGGEMPNAAIHSDLGWGTHAAVLYLSEGEGGTAFWRHKETGATRVNPGDTELFERVRHDWGDASKWEQVFLSGIEMGKAIIYESAMFHSRWPFQAFGDSPETGRLISVAFFSPVAK